jgi:hypothetical protein
MQSLGGRALGAAIVAALAACAPATPAPAAGRTATPSTIGSILAAARGGDTIVLGPGVYEGVEFRGLSFKPELVLDAKAATFKNLQIEKTAGLDIRGGTYQLGPSRARRDGQEVFGAAIRMDAVERIRISNASFVGPGGAKGAFGEGYGIHVIVGQDVEVEKSQFKGFKSGVVMTRVKGFRISDNASTLMRSDGFQVSKSWNGVIEGNTCGDTRVRDDEHPDCIQLWSRPEFPPTSDVVIRNNKAEGPTQGIGMFNHVRKGVDDGGFDRITIENNEIAVSRPNGITLVDGRDSVMRNNKVTTLAGAKFQAKIRSGPGVKRCGNYVAAWNGRAGVDEPKC